MAMAVQISEKTLVRLGHLAFPTRGGKKSYLTPHREQISFVLIYINAFKSLKTKYRQVSLRPQYCEGLLK